MSSADRLTIMNEASTWAKANGVDVATFQSQYKAYNDVLQKNIARANNTQIFAGEVSGSADALIQVINQKDLGKFNAVNIANLAIGKQVNDPLTMKYSFQLQAMTNDLAGYFAASRGANTPENADIQDAAQVVASGLNAGSTQAFKEAIQANEQKVSNVVIRPSRAHSSKYGAFSASATNTNLPELERRPMLHSLRSRSQVRASITTHSSLKCSRRHLPVINPHWTQAQASPSLRHLKKSKMVSLYLYDPIRSFDGRRYTVQIIIKRFSSRNDTVHPWKGIRSQIGLFWPIAKAAGAGIAKEEAGYAQASTPPSSTSVDTSAFNVPEGALKMGAGAVETASSPLAPLFSPLGKLIGYVSDKLSRSPLSSHSHKRRQAQLQNVLPEILAMQRRSPER